MGGKNGATLQTIPENLNFSAVTLDGKDHAPRRQRRPMSAVAPPGALFGPRPIAPYSVSLSFLIALLPRLGAAV
jgi:hypothetical protein